MPFAKTNSVTTADMSDNPEFLQITDAQYAEGLAGLIAGKLISVEGGVFSVQDRPAPPPPVEPPPPDPQVRIISTAQGQALLAQKGVYQQVLDYIAAIPDPTQQLLANIAFGRTNVWQLDSPFLNQAADALGFAADLPAWFNEAATINL